MDTNIIALFLCIIVILLLIIKQIFFKKKQSDGFTAVKPSYQKEILTHLNYDISSIRNLAQLAHNVYKINMYLPVNKVISNGNIESKDFTISDDLKINNEAKFENILNNSNYYDLFYRGMIIPWATSDSDIPQNWGICDGSRYYYDIRYQKYMNYEQNILISSDEVNISTVHTIVATPDLRGRFILNENSICDTHKLNPSKTNDSNKCTDPLKTLKYDPDEIVNKPLGYHEINETGGIDSYKLDVSNLPSHYHTVNVQYNDAYIDWSMGKKDGPNTTHYDVYPIYDDDFFNEKYFFNDKLTYWSQWHNFGLYFQKMNIVYNSDDYQMIANWRDCSMKGLPSTYCKSERYEDYKYLTTFDNLNIFDKLNTDTDTVTAYAQTEIDNTPQWCALYYIMKLY